MCFKFTKFPGVKFDWKNGNDENSMKSMDHQVNHFYGESVHFMFRRSNVIQHIE